jgi:dienelactone hydrolase
MTTFPIKRERPPFPGYLYVPDTPGPHPGVLLLHGSEGGYGDYWSFPNEGPLPVGEDKGSARKARRLAEMGYVAYAFAYFAADKIEGFDQYPPQELVNVEMQQTLRALEWLQNSSYVRGKSVAISGGSRGGEKALLLGSLLEQMKCPVQPAVIIAECPSDFVAPGFNLEMAKAISAGEPVSDNYPNAWTMNGKPLDMYSPIEIEKIRSPIFINYGAKDDIWGPWVKIEKLEERLRVAGKSFMHIDYQNSDDPQAVMDQLTGARPFPEILVIKYLDEGHGPQPGTNSAILDLRLRDLFFKTFLK